VIFIIAQTLETQLTAQRQDEAVKTAFLDIVEAVFKMESEQSAIRNILHLCITALMLLR
jgi:hypothetical protein